MRRAGRYVVLLHDHPAPHHDWMLEVDGALATWRIACAPADLPPGGAPAERLADHRLAYLEFEGEVSRGRGRVRRVEGGTFDAEVNGDVWRVRLGRRLFALEGGTIRTIE